MNSHRNSPCCYDPSPPRPKMVKKRNLATPCSIVTRRSPASNTHQTVEGTKSGQKNFRDSISWIQEVGVKRILRETRSGSYLPRVGELVGGHGHTIQPFSLRHVVLNSYSNLPPPTGRRRANEGKHFQAQFGVFGYDGATSPRVLRLWRLETVAGGAWRTKKATSNMIPLDTCPRRWIWMAGPPSSDYQLQKRAGRSTRYRTRLFPIYKTNFSLQNSFIDAAHAEIRSSWILHLC